MKLSKLTKYLLFTFAGAWLIGLIGFRDLSRCNDIAGKMSFSYALSVSMFMPTIGALIAGADFKGMGWNPRISKNWRLILLAWLSPTVFQMIGAVFYYVVFPDALDLSGAFFKEIDPYQFEQLEKSGSSLVGYYLKESFFSLTSFQLWIAAVMGLGEEIGWRGFMFPELKERLGYTKGVLLGGVIHGAWHFPLMLFAGYEYGRHYIGAPVLGLFAFCVFTVSTGIISDFLHEKSGSILLSGLYHGAGNTVFSVAAGIVYFRYREEQREFAELDQ